MKIRSLLLLLLVSVPLFGRDKTDVVVMQNGDRITCEVKALDAGVLYVSIDYILGTSSMEWSKVDHIESKQPFMVSTQDGYVYTGTIATATQNGERPVKIEVLQTPETKVVLDQMRVVKMDQTADKFLQRFSGLISFGTIYAKGNNSTQYSLNSQTEYLRPRWGASANYSSTLSSSTGTSPSTRNEVTASVRRLLPWNNYFYAGLGDFLQSSTQDISLQTTLGAGLGRYLKNTNRSTITVTGGLAWQNTNYSQAATVSTQNLLAALLAAQVKVFRFNKTTLALTGILLPALSDPGRVRFNTNASYYVKLFSNLSWNISFYGNWDNQPPPGFSGSDYGTSSGLSWTYGNR